MSQSANAIYSTSLSLLTDLYQLTMAYGYWKSGRADQNAVFHLFFRKNPFQGGYVVTAGLAAAVDYLKDFRFDDGDIDYLRTLSGNDGELLFDEDFLTYLRNLELSIEVDAMPEGTVAFPHQPLLRVKGPILECQILETALLNIINFQSLIATKAARICLAAGHDPVLEFGLRRAQGIDGGVTASRAAYIGGCAATSNVLAGRLFGIPVRGTHAHSWVMSFDDELSAFESYAQAMPNNCVFLVDTYDTLAGVSKAIEIGKQLRAKGHRLVGIRLDSGDLAYLSMEARRLLDAADFYDVDIVASNDLDEHLIESLKYQGAKISVWGVGTRLATAFDQPALGGVYKLAAIENEDGQWTPKVKLSEQWIKTSTPGVQQVRRFRNDDGAVADMVFDETIGVSNFMIDPMDVTRRRELDNSLAFEDLLKPVFRNGKSIGVDETLDQIRARVKSELDLFHGGIRRLANPHRYPVGLEADLHQLKSQLVLDARGQNNGRIKLS
jgi:nicotinate phosphoribosyltransferase